MHLSSFKQSRLHHHFIGETDSTYDCMHFTKVGIKKEKERKHNIPLICKVMKFISILKVQSNALFLKAAHQNFPRLPDI